MSTPVTTGVLEGEENLNDFLNHYGWSRTSEGVSGVLWANATNGGEVAVPRGLRPDTGLWDGTIEMIAHSQQSERTDIDRAVRRFWMDVTDFRASSSMVSGNNIAAEAGSSLFSGAWKILRSSATTARGAKVAIGGKYSPAGDRAIDRAMFAQTEPGSYVLPLLMPLSRSLFQDEREAKELGNQVSTDDFLQRTVRESEQRRATRTMAQALSAVSKVLIEPAVEPTTRAINEAVMAGASKELVKALYDIVSEESVSSLDMTFSWAPKAGPVSDTPASVDVPKDSAEVLLLAAKRMSVAREPITAVLSGPIFALYHPKGASFGEATVEAAHRGRVRRIVVTLRGTKILDDAHRWFRAHETLVVSGPVRSTPGGLRVDSPEDIRPLGETMLL